MTRSVAYLYRGPAADAGRYLLVHSTLNAVVAITHDCWWAGAHSTKAELTKPLVDLTHAERTLWRIVEEYSFGDEVTTDISTRGQLDDDDRAALVEAYRIALLDTVDLEQNLEQVSA